MPTEYECPMMASIPDLKSKGTLSLFMQVYSKSITIRKYKITLSINKVIYDKDIDR